MSISSPFSLFIVMITYSALRYPTNLCFSNQHKDFISVKNQYLEFKSCAVRAFYVFAHLCIYKLEVRCGLWRPSIRSLTRRYLQPPYQSETESLRIFIAHFWKLVHKQIKTYYGPVIFVVPSLRPSIHMLVYFAMIICIFCSCIFYHYSLFLFFLLLPPFSLLFGFFSFHYLLFIYFLLLSYGSAMVTILMRLGTRRKVKCKDGQGWNTFLFFVPFILDSFYFHTYFQFLYYSLIFSHVILIKVFHWFWQ